VVFTKIKDGEGTFFRAKGKKKDGGKRERKGGSKENTTESGEGKRERDETTLTPREKSVS